MQGQPLTIYYPDLSARAPGGSHCSTACRDPDQTAR